MSEKQQIKINAVGDVCPIPLIKAKQAIAALGGAGIVSVLVDNEIAVQNLQKMAAQKGYRAAAETKEAQRYEVEIEVPGSNTAEVERQEPGEETKEAMSSEKTENTAKRTAENADASAKAKAGSAEAEKQQTEARETGTTEAESCGPDRRRRGTLVVFSSDQMGDGSEELGGILIKGFVYALTQLEELPEAVICYNGGAKLSCDGSLVLEDLKTLEAEGVEILTCGTCLNYYGLTEKLGVGSITNMYAIAERMAGADRIVKP